MMLFRRIRTYRLALYYLAAIVLAALVLSLAGIGRQPPVNLAFSLGLALIVCLAVNWAFARGFGAGSNWESVCITAIIITLIITPTAPSDLPGVGFLILASEIGRASCRERV